MDTKAHNKDIQRLTHRRTLRHHKTKAIVWGIVLPTFVAPVVGITATFVWGWSLSSIAELVAGAAVLAGFLFGLMIFVFQLRLQVTHDPRIQERAALPRLVDELFANVLYAVGVSVTLTFLLITAATSQVPSANEVPLQLGVWWSAAVVGVGSHLAALLYVVINRTRAAYAEMTRKG